MARVDHYATLGVDRGASADDIRRAYRKLARKHHPDVSGAADAGARFKQITEAYEVLSDPQKRQRYDMFGDGEFGDLSGFGIDDLFSTFFGGARRRDRGPARGADLRVELELDLEEAVNGVRTTVVVPRQETCARCHGNGVEPGSTTSSCPTCNGRGEVRQVQQSLLGRFVTVGTCPRCGGVGTVVDHPCTDCRGEGRTHAERKLEVEIPAGIDDGQQLRVGGQGGSGARSGPPGDLYVLVRLREHPLFRREGDDLIHILRLTPSQAALGDEVEVPTIDGGRAAVRIPPGAQHGRSVRVRGKGAPRLHANGRGDLVVGLEVIVPKAMTKDERALYQRLRAMERGARAGAPAGEADAAERERDEGLLGKVKDAFGG